MDLSLPRNYIPHNLKYWHDYRIDEYCTKFALTDEKEKAEQELEKSQIEQELSKVKQEEIEQLDEELNYQQEITETINENLNDNLELDQEEEKVVEVTSQEMVEGDKLNQESESEDKNN